MNYLLVPKNNFHLIPSVDKTVTFPIPKTPRADSTNTTVHSEARCVPLKYNKHQLVLLYLSASYFNNAEHSKHTSVCCPVVSGQKWQDSPWKFTA